jgi:hypothetical protein
MEENGWSEIRPKGKVPERRSYSSIATYKDRLYIYGGVDLNEGALGNAYSIGLTSLVPMWEQLTLKGFHPHTICRHAAVEVNGTWYICGGEVNFESSSLLFSIELETGTTKKCIIDVYN